MPTLVERVNSSRLLNDDQKAELIRDLCYLKHRGCRLTARADRELRPSELKTIENVERSQSKKLQPDHIYIRVEDIKQSKWKLNCYFLAPVLALAQQYPDILQRLIPLRDPETDTFKTTFYLPPKYKYKLRGKDGELYGIIVTKEVPSDTGTKKWEVKFMEGPDKGNTQVEPENSIQCFKPEPQVVEVTPSKGRWLRLLEKAYSKFIRENNLKHFIGGSPIESFMHLTGWRSRGIPNGDLTTPQDTFGCDRSPEVLYKLFVEEKRCITVAFGFKALKLKYRLFPAHSYAVRDVRRIDEDNYTISLVNPYCPSKEICFPLDEEFVNSVYCDNVVICPYPQTNTSSRTVRTRPAASPHSPSADDEQCSSCSSHEPVGATPVSPRPGPAAAVPPSDLRRLASDARRTGGPAGGLLAVGAMLCFGVLAGLLVLTRCLRKRNARNAAVN